MRVDVVDHLVGLVGVAGRRAVVVEHLAALHDAVGSGELEVAQVAREAELHEVGLLPERAGVLAHRVPVRVAGEAGAEALVELRLRVDRAAAVHAVTQPVVERADAGAAELALRGLLEEGVVRDLAEVPALAVQVDG